jgi:hypothetical protein
LDLVKDDRRRVVAQKEVRILAGVFQVDARVEHHVIVPGEQVLQQGGLADLPGAADHGHGKGLGQTDDALGEQSFLVHAVFLMAPSSICKGISGATLARAIRRSSANMPKTLDFSVGAGHAREIRRLIVAGRPGLRAHAGAGDRS